MIEKRKISIRKVHLNDAERILAWENNPEFWSITENPGPYRLEDIQTFIQQSSDLNTSGQQRYMILNNTQTPIGAIDLFAFNKVEKSAGVGILIANQDDRKNGFAKAALGALIEDLTKSDSVKKLHCIIYPENIPSIKLFLRLGFEETNRELFKATEVIRFEKQL